MSSATSTAGGIGVREPLNSAEALSEAMAGYCDHCAVKLKGTNFVPVTELQEDITSANAGESAILCLNCAARLGEYKAIRRLKQAPRGRGWQETFEGHQMDAEENAKEANLSGDEAVIVERYLAHGYRSGMEPVYFVYSRPLPGGEWHDSAQERGYRRHRPEVRVRRRPEVRVSTHVRRTRK